MSRILIIGAAHHLSLVAGVVAQAAFAKDHEIILLDDDVRQIGRDDTTRHVEALREIAASYCLTASSADYPCFEPKPEHQGPFYRTLPKFKRRQFKP